MSNEQSTIHEFDINLICEYFASIERQGPGSPEVTKQALQFVDNLTENSRILDIGCGTGGQTMVLAQNTTCNIIGLDLFPGFIDIFNTNAQKLDLAQRVSGIIGSMDNLPFDNEQFDLIWSEGAIYNIGFERGIREWNKFLKPGGYIAVTEASWFTEQRPQEITDFWQNAYPEIDTIAHKVAHMQTHGYIPIATFILPEKCWIDHFYELQIEVQEPFLQKYKGNKTAEELVAYERHEYELYKKYKAYYGYVFYIGKKI